METYSNHKNQQYIEAQKHVKKLKGFYIHAIVYIAVNAFIILDNVLDDHQSIFDMDNYWTAILWGIGLAAHALSVFNPHFIFGKNWEERKINEILNKEKKMHVKNRV